MNIEVDNMTIGVTGPKTLPDWLLKIHTLTYDYLIKECMERGIKINATIEHRGTIVCTIPDLNIEITIFNTRMIGYNWSYSLLKTD